MSVSCQSLPKGNHGSGPSLQKPSPLTKRCVVSLGQNPGKHAVLVSADGSHSTSAKSSPDFYSLFFHNSSREKMLKTYLLG